jgi:hypothetical protein
MNRRLLGALFVGLFTVGTPSAAGAQPRPAVAAPQPQAAAAPPIDERSARDTQQRLQELFRNYPPSLARVLQLDPTLLTNQDYLAPYPALATFVAQHPDIVHHAAFYLGQPDSRIQEDARSRAVRIFGEVMGEVFVLCGFVAFFVTVGWLARLIVDHRRWLRATKTQTEVHAKLFDRLTSNEELLAYIQTPSGQRFLQSASVTLDSSSRAIGAPISRILWSVQAGIVLAVVGIGLWFAKSNAVEELTGPLNIVAILIVALGVGFAISAAVAYAMSQRLGLLEPPKP